MRSLSSRSAAAAKLLAAAALVLPIASCGGGATGEASQSSNDRFVVSADAGVVGESAAGQVLQYADCYDWEDGSVDERRATVVQLREQLTPQVAEDPESPLSDPDAYEKLDGSCTAGPKSLRLYKLYVRMQALGTLESRLDEG